MYNAIGYTGTIEELNSLIRQAVDQPGVEGILIFACDANGFTPQEVDPILAKVPIPIFGGIFPQILYMGEHYDRGTLIVGLYTKPHLVTIPLLNDQVTDIHKTLASSVYDDEVRSARTLFVWVDGLSCQIGHLIEEIFSVFGSEFNYVGGGAGSLSFERKPCLFSNQGLLQDCALLAFVDLESGIGVRHGWQPLRGPYKVTESEQNVIKSLDWQPALDVYQSVVNPHSDKNVDRENFFDIAKKFPFGINLLNAERIVRDPIMATDNKELVCVGEVPTESYVDILVGSPGDLIAAAQSALHLAQNSYRGAEEKQVTLFIDCISRALFLQTQFTDELQVVYDESSPMIGALTLGEIANSGTDYLQFYNKTAVVAILESE